MNAPAVPPEGRNITIGSHVEAAFRLFDQLPFGVRQDLARLIYLYLHDSAGYSKNRLTIFSARRTPEPHDPRIPPPADDEPAVAAPVAPVAAPAPFGVSSPGHGGAVHQFGGPRRRRLPAAVSETPPDSDPSKASESVGEPYPGTPPSENDHFPTAPPVLRNQAGEVIDGQAEAPGPRADDQAPIWLHFICDDCGHAMCEARWSHERKADPATWFGWMDGQARLHSTACKGPTPAAAGTVITGRLTILVEGRHITITDRTVAGHGIRCKRTELVEVLEAVGYSVTERGRCVCGCLLHSGDVDGRCDSCRGESR